jgi:hypothetical protein
MKKISISVISIVGLLLPVTPTFATAMATINIGAGAFPAFDGVTIISAGGIPQSSSLSDIEPAGHGRQLVANGNGKLGGGSYEHQPHIRALFGFAWDLQTSQPGKQASFSSTIQVGRNTVHDQITCFAGFIGGNCPNLQDFENVNAGANDLPLDEVVTIPIAITVEAVAGVSRCCRAVACGSFVYNPFGSPRSGNQISVQIEGADLHLMVEVGPV